MKTFLVFILLLLTYHCSSQQRAPKGFIYITATDDNVKHVMEYVDPTIEQVDTLVQLGRNYTQVNRDTSLMIIERAIEICKRKKGAVWKKNYGRALSSKGAALENELGIETTLLARKVFEEAAHPRGIASADRILGTIYRDRGNLNEAINAFLSSIRIYQETNTDPRALLNPLEGISDIYFSLGDYQKAKLYLSQAIMIADTTDSFHRSSMLRRSHARHLFEYANKLTVVRDSVLNNIDKNALSDSIRHYQKLALSEASNAVQLAKDINDPKEILSSLLVVIDLNLELQQFESAFTLATEALPKAEAIGELQLIAVSKLHLAKSLYGLKRYKLALSYAEPAYTTLYNSGFKSELLPYYDLLIIIYINLGKSEQALQLLQGRNDLEKEENSLATKTAIAEAETKYLTSEKEKQILSQERDILQLAAKNERINNQYQMLLAGLLVISSLLFMALRLKNIKKDIEDKRVFAEQLITGQETERKRIARDLHDGVGQSLLLIKKQFQTSSNITNGSKQLLSQTLEEVRSISHGLHPFQLDKFGLTTTIENTIQAIRESTDLFISTEMEDIDQHIPKTSQIHIFRTIQEALNNIIKHSNATAAKITIKVNQQEVHIAVQDNGDGFNVQLASTTSKSLGIRTMHERISSIGGHLKILPGKPNGTKIEIAIPQM